MARASKFRTTIQPTMALGQIWKDKNDTHRRVVSMDDWEIYFSRIPDGYRTRVQRVSKGGAPSGGYLHVAKSEPQDNPVHVRRALGGGERSDTFCGLSAEGLITTTMNNLPWWKRRAKNSKRLEICAECSKRVTDGIHTMIEMSEAVA